MATEIQLPFWRTVRRGLSRRCGACGHGRLFPGWFRMVDRCPGCGLVFARSEGQWLGSLGVNTIVTFAVLFVMLMVGGFATAPDVPVVPLMSALLVVAVGLPVLLFPFSRTLWTSIDLLARPPRPDELDLTAPGVPVET